MGSMAPYMHNVMEGQRVASQLGMQRPGHGMMGNSGAEYLQQPPLGPPGNLAPWPYMHGQPPHLGGAMMGPGGALLGAHGGLEAMGAVPHRRQFGSGRLDDDYRDYGGAHIPPHMQDPNTAQWAGDGWSGMAMSASMPPKAYSDRMTGMFDGPTPPHLYGVQAGGPAPYPEYS